MKYQFKNGELYQGDALNILIKLPTNSVDAIITDPPSGISFMGKDWDSDKGGRNKWINWLARIMHESRRVLKPGGHALVWALPRTSHWTGMALERAGFEVRDCITHFYDARVETGRFLDSLSPEQLQLFEIMLANYSGDRAIISHLFASGFPKNHNIGRKIAQLNGEDVPTSKGFNTAGEGSGKKQNPELDSYHKDYVKPNYNNEWVGWGTALKPAAEMWWLVRNPLAESSVTENVLRHRTGGLNIDATRIPHDENCKLMKLSPPSESGKLTHGGHHVDTLELKPEGRWPANVTHDGSQEVVERFPFPNSSGGDGYKNSIFKGAGGKKTGGHGFGDNGSASRFFYCSKPGKKDREEGLEDMKAIHRVNGNKWTDKDYRVEKGVRPENAESGPRKNIHPTVKPTKLIRYFARLITPPGGVVLDMFAGSGTTGKAAVREGFRFILIEKVMDYVKIIRMRIEDVEIIRMRIEDVEKERDRKVRANLKSHFHKFMKKKK